MKVLNIRIAQGFWLIKEGNGGSFFQNGDLKINRRL